MLSYIEHCARRIEAAASYSGWERPPYPFESGWNIGRVVMTRTVIDDLTIAPGLYHHTPELDRLFKAKEKRQNRKHFS